MAEKTMINNLTEGSVARKLISFSLPFIAANALQIVYNIVDMVIVGNFVGAEALSGVSVGGDLLNFCTLMGMGIANAAQVMIAQGVGKGDRESIKHTIGTLFSSLTIGAIIIGGLAMIFTPQLLGLLNCPEDAFAQATSYCAVCFWGMIFIYGYNAVSAVLRGMGDSRRPLVFITIAAVFNLLLDLLFVGVFKWESAGAALATILGQALSLIISVVYLYRKREAFGFDFKPRSFAIRKEILIPLYKLGIPMSLQFAAISISMMFVNSLINAYGVAASAVTGVGNKLRQIVSIVTRSMATAGAAMIGQNLGARKPERVKKIVRISLAICLTTFFVLGTIFLIFPRQIFSLFNDSEAVLALAADQMFFCVVCMSSQALMAPFNAVVHGSDNSLLGLIMGMLNGIIARVGLALLFGNVMHMGLRGYWLGNAAAGYVTFFIAAAYYLSGRWKTRKLMVRE